MPSWSSKGKRKMAACKNQASPRTWGLQVGAMVSALFFSWLCADSMREKIRFRRHTCPSPQRGGKEKKEGEPVDGASGQGGWGGRKPAGSVSKTFEHAGGPHRLYRLDRLIGRDHNSPKLINFWLSSWRYFEFPIDQFIANSFFHWFLIEQLNWFLIEPLTTFWIN